MAGRGGWRRFYLCSCGGGLLVCGLLRWRLGRDRWECVALGEQCSLLRVGGNDGFIMDACVCEDDWP